MVRPLPSHGFYPVLIHSKMFIGLMQDKICVAMILRRQYPKDRDHLCVVYVLVRHVDAGVDEDVCRPQTCPRTLSGVT